MIAAHRTASNRVTSLLSWVLRSSEPPGGPTRRRGAAEGKNEQARPLRCVVENAPDAFARAAYHAQPMVAAKRHVLVVEDEPGLQRLVRRRAAQENLEVIEALTGADGLALAKATQPDLIVLDLHLPDGRGVDLVIRLKADPTTTSIPIVAWSASGDIDEEDDVLLAGAAAYCSKTDLRALFMKILELMVPSAARGAESAGRPSA